MKGQSTLEFLLVFIFFLGVLLLGSLSIVSHYTSMNIQLLVFEASRLFLVEDEETVALRFNQKITKLTGSNLKLLRSNNKMYQGAFVEYDQKVFSLYPFRISPIKVKLIAESYLGKESTQKECKERLCELFFQGDCIEKQDVTLFDDGC